MSMRKRWLYGCLFVPLIVLLLTIAVDAAGAEYSGILDIADRTYQSGSLSFTAELSGISPQGQITAAVFSENGIFKTSVFYPAQASVKVELSVGSTDTVKLAWLDNRQRFLAPPEILRMERSDAETNGEFTAQLHQLISGFNPVGGTEAADEDDPYYLQRLIMKCDTLPDLTGRTPSNILTGPDGLYILSFSTPGATRDCAAYLRTQPSVRYVEPDRLLNMAIEEELENSAQLQASSSYHSWGVEATGIGAYAENLRQRGLSGAVTVAVLDTGIDAEHPFLRGRLLSASNLSTEPDARDGNGHGTHVAGIVAECTQGLNVNILPVKVMNEFGSFTTLSLIGGIYEAASRGANIINLSLSAPATEQYQAIEEAVRYALSKNITIVAAAGNQNTDTSMRTPARMEECLTVSAVRQNETRYDLSNYGDAVDLTAPGALVNSCIPGGLFKDMSGTSMAAPHVSAAAALLIYERGASMTPTQISKTLCGAARFVTNQTGWKKEFGYGMLNLLPFISVQRVTISYQPNGGSGSVSSQTVNAGESAVLKGNTFTRNGYDFTGWNTKADGTGIAYGNQASVNIRENLTLYAQWKRTAGAYAILYSGGELVFQTRNTPETERTVIETYPIYTGTGGSAEYAAWYDQRANIKQVTFAEKIQPVSTALWFFGCGNLTTFSGLDKLDTSKTTDMSQMFADCVALTELDLTAFNTGSVTNMERMFFGCTALKTILASATFTTGAVTSSRDMFKDCTSLVGGSGTKYGSTHTDKTYARIDGGTSAPGYLTDPNSMIYAVLYDDGELVFQNNNRTESGRSVTGVYEVKDHYSGVSNDYAPWHEKRTSITTATIADRIQPLSTAYWFYDLNHMTTIKNIGNLNTSNVTSMSHMFCGCSGLSSLDISGFDTSNVTSMSWMFSGCSGLKSLDVSNFDTSNITTMSSMFEGCYNLTILDVSGFDTSNATSMSWMFYGCSGLTSVDVSGFDTSNVTSMWCMFYECSRLSSLDVSGFDTSNVTFMPYMFSGCSGLTSLDVGSFDTRNVIDMTSMFSNCSGLTILDVSGFDTSNVTSMSWMFYGCSGLTSVDVSGFDTSNVTSMWCMFYECSRLSSLDVSGFDTSNVTNMKWMFYRCSQLKTICASNLFVTGQVSSSDEMFSGCTSLVGGSGTKYDSSHTDRAYAHIDGGISNPGYFTLKTSSADVMFIAAASQSKRIVSNSTQVNSYRVYNAVVNGEISTVCIDEATNIPDSVVPSGGGTLSTNSDCFKQYYSIIANDVTEDSDGIITSLRWRSNDATIHYAYGIRKYIDGEIRVNTNAALSSASRKIITVSDTVQVYYVNSDGEIEEIDVEDIATDSDDVVYYIMEKGEVTYLWWCEYNSVKDGDPPSLGSK